jgi:hypothetical protein
MSAITKMMEEMEAVHPTAKMGKPAKVIVEWIKAYAEAKSAEYNDNKDKGNITFGKYKGQSVEQVANLEKGLDYLGWVSRQTWMAEDKFPSLYPKIMATLKKD